MPKLGSGDPAEWWKCLFQDIQEQDVGLVGYVLTDLWDC